MKISKSIYDRMNVKTFIHSIRTGNEKLVQAHCESKKFSPSDYEKALVLSAAWGKDELVKYMSRLGWDCFDKERAINVASSRGMTGCVRILDVEGADIHAEEDFTLYLSATQGRVSTSVYLLLNEPGFQNVEYSLKTAFRRGHKAFSMDCLNFFGQAKNPQNALEWSIKKHKTEFAKGALEAGANANINNGELLIKSITDGQDEIVSMLAQYGADFMARDERVLLDAVRKANKKSMTELVYQNLKRAKENGVVLRPGEGSSKGLKTIN